MANTTPVVLSIKDLVPFERNVRKDTDQDHIDTLAADIAETGMLHPITVRKNAEGQFEVVAGWRRVLAHKHLNKETILANVLDVDVDKAFEISLAENMHRHPLKYADKCLAIRQCYDQCQGNIREVVMKTRLAPTTIRRYVDISTLPQEIIARLDSDGDDHITLKQALAMVQAQNAVPSLPMDEATMAAEAAANEDDEEARPSKKKKESVKKYPWIFDEQEKPIPIPSELYGAVYEMVLSYDGDSE